MVGVIDYSTIQPRSRDEVLADLETIGGNSPEADIADLGRIKPYAEKFGALLEFNEVCIRLGLSV